MARMEGMKIALPRKSTRARAWRQVGLRVYLTLRKKKVMASARPEIGKFK